MDIDNFSCSCLLLHLSRKENFSVQIFDKDVKKLCDRAGRRGRGHHEGQRREGEISL